jgi:DNA-binding HxlR family transcriptional regulator
MKQINGDCPISKVAILLSDTWTMLIMHYLIESPKRFCDLEKALSGISTRTLTLKLKKLHSNQMLDKNKEGYYVATEKGRGLRLIENSMKRYQARYLA